MYDLKLKSPLGDTIQFTDWEKENIDYLRDHPNIKKLWLVSEERKTGATYFAKLLLFFRKPCTKTFVISHNLFWSKYISRHMPIELYLGPNGYMDGYSKDGEWYRASNFLKSVTLFGLEKEINKDNKLLEYECLYDNEFDVKKYVELCSYNFKFFVINVSAKDIDKARPYIEQDKDKDDVLIVNIKESLFKQ